MDNFKVSRRNFIHGMSALSFSFALDPKSAFAEASTTFSPHGIIRIEPDSTVRISMPHAEMGQGAYTGMAQILADELDADWLHVVAEHIESLDPAFNHTGWGTIATGASTSINNQWENLRKIGATARHMLVRAAALEWDVDPKSLTTRNSYVIDAANQRRSSYGELTTRAASLSPPKTVSLKTSQQFTLIGNNLQRIDSKIKAVGAAQFGIDVQLPDTYCAAIAHCPIFGGTVESYDASEAQKMPGVKAVVQIPTGVAVIADSFWHAKQAKDVL
ncbi:MAG: molybdopterin cofactor-binding domain-containing protein, partial [Gammaproteobacteria bacterium]